MQIHNLPSIVKTKKKRLGQGHGSGRVKTSGRGTKGQNARGSMPIYFEGGALSLIKRLPFQRGKDKNKSIKTKPVVINLDNLSRIPTDKVIDIDTLIAYHVVSDEAKQRGVKLLANGTIRQAYTVHIPASKAASEKIIKAGGSLKTV
jgi:large subunit ribosomal protein L15